MSIWIRAVVLFGVALLVAGRSLAVMTAGSDAPAPTRILVKTRPGASRGATHERATRRAGAAQPTAKWKRLLRAAEVGPAARAVGLDRWDVVEPPAGMSVADLLRRYAADRDVEVAELDATVTAQDTIPNDPLFDDLWGLAKIGAPAAWDVELGDTSLVVGVLDTGVDLDHPDLAAALWTNPGEIAGNGVDDDGNGFVDDVNGYDFYHDDGDPSDDHGHGTHVAGTIGAIGNNGVGVAGVTWRVRIMALKFLGAGGSGAVSDAVRALAYAVQMGARLTNNSWGGSGTTHAMRDAIAAAQVAGQLFVAAAGNNGRDIDQIPFYPAGLDLDAIISVAASDELDRLAVFSNYGPRSVDLVAPGVDIVSTLRGRAYGPLSGTSMATPHVAGAAALVWSRVPWMRADEVKERLLANTHPVDIDVLTGGRLDLAAAFVGLGIGSDDVTPPAAVSDLSVTSVGHDRVQLQWSAGHDDGEVGRAARYDLRWSNAPITEANFALATPAVGEPFPSGAGTELATVLDLFQGRDHWFALRVQDEAENVSPLSNVVTATTVALTPSALAIAGGDAQVGPGAAVLPEALEVMVTDDVGRGVSGIPVAFDLVEGAADAFVTPPAAVSDAAGIARAQLTLGTVQPQQPGVPHRVVASAAGVGSVELRAGAIPLVDLAITWRSSGTPPFTGNFATSQFATGDLDGDGLGEILVRVTHSPLFPETGPYLSELVLLETRGDDWTVAWSQPDANWYQFSAHEIGDVDGDGRAEVVDVVAELYGAETMAPRILAPDGDGNLVPQPHPIVLPRQLGGQPFIPAQVLIGDLDRDGQPEIVVWGHANGSRVSVWEHTGAPGTYDFVPRPGFETTERLDGGGAGVISWSMGDADQDGRPDLVPGAIEGASNPLFTSLRFEWNEASDALLRLPGLGLSSALVPKDPGIALAAVANATAVGDIDADGTPETVAAGWMGCTCILLLLGNSYDPHPLEPCYNGNLAVFRGIADETFEFVWSNVGTLTCAANVATDLFATTLASLNALSVDQSAVFVGGSPGVEAIRAYGYNPFSFRPDFLLPLWKGPDSLNGSVLKLASGDFDADGKPEVIAKFVDRRVRPVLDDVIVFEEQLDLDGPNSAPVLRPIGPKAAVAGVPLVFSLAATDINADLLVYDATGLPAGATFDALRRTFDWTADGSQAGIYVVTFTVSDGQATDSEEVTIVARRDDDGDGVGEEPNPIDNCPTIPNPEQRDRDGDARGDACDSCPNDAANDADGDGHCADLDNCPFAANPGQLDRDADDVGDDCDSCPEAADTDQRDTDGDGLGDACDGVIDSCPSGNGSLRLKKLSLRYGAGGSGADMKLKAVLDPTATSAIAAGGDITVVVVGQSAPILSARVPSSRLIRSTDGRKLEADGDGSATDGLTLLRLRRSGIGEWKLTSKGEQMSAGPPATGAGILLRIGDACFSAPPVTCTVRRGNVMRCR